MNPKTTISGRTRSRYPSKASITRVVQGARDAGLHVSGVIVSSDGSVEIRQDQRQSGPLENELTIDEALAAWEVQNGLARDS